MVSDLALKYGNIKAARLRKRDKRESDRKLRSDSLLVENSARSRLGLRGLATQTHSMKQAFTYYQVLAFPMFSNPPKSRASP